MSERDSESERERERLAPQTSSPIQYCLHSVGDKGRDEAGDWTMTGLSCGKGRRGVYNGSRSSYGMGFISIKREATLSPLYAPVLYSYKQT